jgi:hypothetical protein
MFAARNILLLTLIVDDEQSSNDRCIWNIYYHLYLTEQCLELLQNQSKKLHSLSTSIHTWHQSKYGKLLRMCDQQTLRSIHYVWKSYCCTNLSKEEQASYDQLFKSSIQKTMDFGTRKLGPGMAMNMTGIRSAAPTSFQSMTDLPALNKLFWDHGITDKDSGNPSQARRPNPMFGSMLTDNTTLHYGTDPLLGFHLATSYISFVSGSPLQPEPPRHTGIQKVVEAARLQFRAWGRCFKRCDRQSLVLRFFNGEALAFCHTLQHKRLTGDATSANWYRGPGCPEKLTIDGEDYAGSCKAPLSFNVIDTSNLIDHLGAINLLVAISPLLDNTPSATLYTETLVKRETNQKASIDELLCGHFPTMSVILGLFPVEYWANATATSTVDEAFLDAIQRKMGSVEDHKGQM